MKFANCLPSRNSCRRHSLSPPLPRLGAALTVIGLISCCYGKKAAIKATGNGEMSSQPAAGPQSVRNGEREGSSQPLLPFVQLRPGPGLTAKQTLLLSGRAPCNFPRGPTLNFYTRGVMIPIFFGIGIGINHAAVGICWSRNHNCWNHINNWNWFHYWNQFH